MLLQQMLHMMESKINNICWSFFFIVWSSGDEDDGPIYSPVSPDHETSSDEDYDDIDTLQWTEDLTWASQRDEQRNIRLKRMFVKSWTALKGNFKTCLDGGNLRSIIGWFVGWWEPKHQTQTWRYVSCSLNVEEDVTFELYAVLDFIIFNKNVLVVVFFKQVYIVNIVLIFGFKYKYIYSCDVHCMAESMKTHKHHTHMWLLVILKPSATLTASTL